MQLPAAESARLRLDAAAFAAAAAFVAPLLAQPLGIVGKAGSSLEIASPLFDSREAGEYS